AGTASITAVAVPIVPSSMMAVGAPPPDGPEELALLERPVPRVGPDEVLIQVAAAGVNRPDILQRMGMYPPPPGASSIPGLEGAGKIAAVGGEVGRERLGQPVCALIAGGGYAQYAVAPAGQCLTVPPMLSM